jgi:small subunit ribosomal protein S15e
LQTTGRKRSFKKFQYRGIELDRLLDMKMDALVKILPARIRRKFARGLKRGANTLMRKIRQAKKDAPEGEKPAVVRTHLRDMVVLPEVSMMDTERGKTAGQVSWPWPRPQSPMIPTYPLYHFLSLLFFLTSDR